ncbi:MAG TPA: hypothetical protein PLM98_12380 [Thiolinea sp.]|nr:hypothetical protein [Thiolinea sp.]
MLKKIAVLSILFALSTVIHATETNAVSNASSAANSSKSLPKPFEKLASIYVDDTVTIYYDKNLTEIINKETTVEGGEPTYRVLKTKINKDSDQIYTVDYSAGASADPGFNFYKQTGDALKEIEQGIGGLVLIIPGNGFIYVSGHTNSMFDARRKYKIENDKLVEIKQPFYYVGVDTNLKQDLEIFSDETLKTSLGSLAKDSPVSVLLYKDENYLLKSSLGLVGWAKIPESLYPGETIEGIYFAGD